MTKFSLTIVGSSAISSPDSWPMSMHLPRPSEIEAYYKYGEGFHDEVVDADKMQWVRDGSYLQKSPSHARVASMLRIRLQRRKETRSFI